MNALTRLIQCILICTPIVLLGYLVNQQFVFDGTFVVKHGVAETSPFIDRLLPDQRVNDPVIQDGQMIQELIADPVFFFVHPQRQYSTATFDVWFQNTNVPIVEFGGLAQTNPEVYDLQPMQNLLIDQSKWFRLDDGKTVLLQRTKQFDSIDAFLNHLPSPDSIAVYHSDVLPPFRLSGYQASTTQQVINVSLRGHHEFKTYIKDEPLSVQFEFMDMNRDQGADPLSITVFDEQGQPVGGTRVEDDGDMTSVARPSPLRSSTLSLTGLSEGVYKIVVDGSRDLFVRSIKTSQQKFIVLNTIFLADDVGYREEPQAVRIFTTAKRIQAQTRHSEGVQTLRVGGKTFEIKQPYQLYTHTSSSPGLVDVDVPKPDVELFVDQPVAFSAEAFFNPEPNRLQFYTDSNTQDIDFVIADYQSPERVGDWFVAHLEVDLSKLTFQTEKPEMRFFREGSWKFVFSLPGAEERHASLKIKTMDLELTGKTFTIKDMVSYLFSP